MSFWGVRGSIPIPGAHTARWGGNSSCVEVRGDDGTTVVFDCGTGARALGFDLMRRSGRQLDLLFSHFHMDHVFGFPFFVPLYTPGYEVRVSLPAFSADEGRERLARYLNGIYHPVRLDDVPAQVTFNPVRANRSFSVGAFEATPIAMNHPGGATGYRLSGATGSMAYMTDTAPFAKPGEGVEAGLEPTKAEARVLKALKNCDLVVYDTMFSKAEYLEKMTWGHSYPEYAYALCKAAGVKTLVLFHHLPEADDDALDALEAHWATFSEPSVIVAREGSTTEARG